MPSHNSSAAIPSREIAFLQVQKRALAHKLARYESALSQCDNCLENDSLQRAVDETALHITSLDELLREQEKAGHIPLESALLARAEYLHKAAQRLSHNWRHGQATPSAYWQAESHLAFLNHLLRDWHAYRDGRLSNADIHAEHSKNGDDQPNNGSAARPIDHPRARSHPWLVQPHGEASNGAASAPGQHHLLDEHAIEAVHARIEEVLEEAAYPPDHLEIIIEPDGQVIVTGYAHDEDQRDDILARLLDLDAIEQVITDVQLVEAQHCPVCHPPSDQATGHAANNQAHDDHAPDA